MKKLLALLALVAAVGLAAPAFAPDKPSEGPAAAAPGADAGRARPARGSAARQQARRGGQAEARQRQHGVDDHRDNTGHPDDDPRPCALLWRPGPRQEHAVGADARLRDVLPGLGAVGALWL